MSALVLGGVRSRYCNFVIRCFTHSQPPSVGQHKYKQPHLHKATKTEEEKWDVNKIRNIGIIAHIDAGKTTTTERMLYFSGLTKAMGDVDSGDTVTDYMVQERERGITITSAAITFYWKHFRINLIDTPGHVDFTLEVERSLRVLDGAVTVLDSSKGIEAQTMTVWRQAKKFNIPSIIFLNKMDKPTASVEKCMKSITEKLKITPVLISTPLAEGKRFNGVADLISMECLEWSDDTDGRDFTVRTIDKTSKEYDTLQSAREKLIGLLADLDSEFAESVLQCPTVADVPSMSIDSTLRRLTLSRRVAPVLCGSSLKKKGVQPILTAICKYLPSPNERRHGFLPFYGEDNMSALAFKIITDRHLGRLTFVRVYGGRLAPNSKIYNVNKSCVEFVQRIYLPHSDEMQETSFVAAGNIAVVPNLQHTYTGDTLVQSAEVAKTASKAFDKFKCDKASDENFALAEVDTTIHDKFVLTNIDAPDPVFFCSIEPPNASSQKKFEEALKQLVREDPSLRVREDSESLQTILEGMGQLQIEIVKDRLLREFNLEVFLGPVQINYKESLLSGGEETHEIDESQNQKTYQVKVTLKVDVLPELGHLKSVGHLGSLKSLSNHYLDALKDGCVNAAFQGPTIGYPVMNIRVTVLDFSCAHGTPIALVGACATACLRNIMKNAGSQILEPVMKLEITVPEQYANRVLADVTRRRANIDDSEWLEDENSRVIRCTAPLSELVDYSSSLRMLSSGNANLHMELAGYVAMTNEESKILKTKVTSWKWRS